MNYIGNTESGALFSPCRSYRYTLWRRFESNPDHPIMPAQMCAFIGLNPSTADEKINDPTVTRCIGFAKRWGFRGFVMLNIFAYRATDPRVMKAQADPIGPMNDVVLAAATNVCGRVVACWGTHGAHKNRGAIVLSLLKATMGMMPLTHFGLTKDRLPRHPLYLSNATMLDRFW